MYIEPILVLDKAMKEAGKNVKKYEVGYWKMQKIDLHELSYADDIELIAKDEKTLNKNLEIYRKTLNKINMNVNQEKTSTMIVSRKGNDILCTYIGKKRLEQVGKFKYLESTITQNGKIDEKITKRKTATGRLFNS